MRAFTHLRLGVSALRRRDEGAGLPPRPRMRGGFVAFLVLTASSSAASAQVFEVSGGGFHQVGSVAKPQLSAPRTAIKSRTMALAVQAAAARYHLAPELLDAVARRESGYRADAVSPAGAVGVMQLMPATARELGVDPRDPVANLNAGAAYLRAQLDRFDGHIDLALAAYNAGPQAVERHAGVPPYRETQAYIAANLKRLAEQSLAAPSTFDLAGEP